LSHGDCHLDLDRLDAVPGRLVITGSQGGRETITPASALCGWPNISERRSPSFPVAMPA
jgi:hypothetical protein